MFSKAQGLDAQAKGEVLLSKRNGEVEMHKQRRKYFSAGGMGQQKCTSKRGNTSQQEGWGIRNFSFGNYTGKQKLGGIRVHLVVRTSGTDLRLEQSVVVLGVVHRWLAFDPLFFWGGGGPIQRSGQLCCLNSSQQGVSKSNNFGAQFIKCLSYKHEDPRLIPEIT